MSEDAKRLPDRELLEFQHKLIYKLQAELESRDRQIATQDELIAALKELIDSLEDECQTRVFHKFIAPVGFI